MYTLGVVGRSDTGKTRLVERLVERLSNRGSVATIKHLTHAPDIDTAGKDTARHRAAGAGVTYGIADETGWFATGEVRTLEETLTSVATEYDYCLVEGFHRAPIPKVALGTGVDADESTILHRADSGEAADVASIESKLHETEPYVTLESLVRTVKSHPQADRAGAIATFTGRVRAKDHPDDRPTKYLEFEKYSPIAAERMDALERELETREGVFSVELRHRTGIVERGEDIVFVVVLAGHRSEAFETVEDGINRLKDEVPIFKKEVTVSDEFWVHQRPEQ